MAPRHQAEELRVGLPAGLLVVLEREVGEPHRPDRAGVLSERRLVVLADLAQGADARIHRKSGLLGVGLHRLPPAVPLALLLQDTVDGGGRRGRHLREDWVPRGVAYGAGGVLPHYGGLVCDTLQRLGHEAVPVWDAPRAEAVDGVLRHVEGQAPVAVGGALLEELLHELHVGLQGHLGELVGAGAHQRPRHVGQREAHGLRRGARAEVVVVVV
mmetsp:Transcript_107532/g.335250  ORF Transcript_107532/g.335250 Transcript_107532/m.335250 type:complete len:214 (-) Transcript_107532:89-730(-)